MASNAEILAQLGKLAEMERAYGPIEQIEFTRLRYSPGKTPDFPAILAAVKRLVKIEEAAKRCDFEGLAEYFDTEQFIYKRWGGERGSCELQNDLRALDAALKEPQ